MFSVPPLDGGGGSYIKWVVSVRFGLPAIVLLLVVWNLFWTLTLHVSDHALHITSSCTRISPSNSCIQNISQGKGVVYTE